RLEGDSEPVMVGGDGTTTPGLNPGDMGAIVFYRNHILQPASWKRTERAGTPTVPCVPQEWWKSVDAYFRCNDDGQSWRSVGPDGFPARWTFKTTTEVKKCTHCQFIGNVFEGGFYGAQTGKCLNLK